MRIVLFAVFAWLTFNCQAGLLIVEPLLTVDTGDSDTAEISAFDPASNQLFVTNSEDDEVNVYDLSSIGDGASLVFSIDIGALGEGGPNSVAVANSIVAIAVEADTDTDPGFVFFYDVSGTLLNQVTVGALPDSVAFTSDGNSLVVANEGEPDDDENIDPEGSISVVDLSAGVAAASVTTLAFTDFNIDGPRASELPPGIRIIGFGGPDPVTVAQDLEPEFVAISPDNSLAYISLQENNGLAIVDLVALEILSIVDATRKNYNLPGNGFDAANDNVIDIQNFPVTGLFQPDGIAVTNINGQDFVFAANEGDTRSFEESVVEDEILDPVAFPAGLPSALDNLEITLVDSDPDQDGDLDEIVAFGGRSFSIYDGVGNLVFESGDDFEQFTAPFGLPLFNDDDSESDERGPEPEGIAVTKIGDEYFAFIGLERSSGVMVYDVTTPAMAEFVQFLPSSELESEPEGISIISAEDSPTDSPLLIVTNENAGSIDIFSVENITAPAVPALQPGMLLLLLLLLSGIGSIAAVRHKKRSQ